MDAKEARDLKEMLRNQQVGDTVSVGSRSALKMRNAKWHCGAKGSLDGTSLGILSAVSFLMNKSEEKDTVPCETCGAPTYMTSTKRCNDCYEVELRLPKFLIHAKGRAHVRQLLAGLKKQEVEDEKLVHELCEKGVQICSINGCTFFGSKKPKEVVS